MKILENYATSAGVKIQKDPHEFPVNFHPILGKYITISIKTGQSSKNYDYFQDVVKIIYPVLFQNNIIIVQIGESDEFPIPGCVIKTGLSFRESAFIVQNSSLHVSGDSCFCHFAGHVKTPLLGLYGATSPSSTGPYWTGAFEALQGNSGIPGYNADEKDAPKEINNIFPENIANKIFKMLNIKARLNIKTICFGKLYNNSQISFIPDFEPQYKKLQSCKLLVRMDVCHNEEIVSKLMNYRKVELSIMAEKPLSENFLKYCQGRVHRILQILKDGYKISDLENLKNSGIPYILVWAGKEESLPDARLELFDFEPVGLKRIEKDSRITRDSIFSTKQFFLGRGKHYSSVWHYNHGISEDSREVGREVGDAIDSDDFWESKDAFYFFNKLTNK